LAANLFNKLKGEVSQLENLSDALAWRAKTVSAGSSSDLRSVIDYLIVGTFQHFGEDTGERQRHTLFENNGEVESMREAAHNLDSRLFDKPVVEAKNSEPPQSPPSPSVAPQVLPHRRPVIVGGGGSSVIESRIDGDFEGFDGETIIKLMDGSIWEQAEYYYHYQYGYMTPVVVFSSAGGWKIQVEGVPKAVRVRRIK
jgi:hypothetical protein